MKGSSASIPAGTPRVWLGKGVWSGLRGVTLVSPSQAVVGSIKVQMVEA